MLNKKDPVFITKVCLLILCGAFVFSFVTSAFSPKVEAQAVDSQEELPSFRNLNAPIPNSGELPRISIGTFLEKIAKTTGIYSFIYDRIEKDTTIIDDNTGKPKTTTVPGWQELLMIAVGFLILYILERIRNLNHCFLFP